MVEKGYTAVETKSKAVEIDEGLRRYMISIYNYMTVALVVTGVVAAVIANTSLIRLFFDINGGLSVLGWIALLSPIAVIFWFNNVAAKGSVVQLKAIFYLFSVLMAVSLTPVFLVYTGASVAKVFLITSVTFGGMSIYGYTTKKDLTSWGSFLRMGLWGIIIAMIVNIFMRSGPMDYAISVIAVFVFTGLIAYDTQKIRQIYYSGDSEDTQGRKALVGALNLYLDFINLFVHLLRLIGDRR